MCGQLIDGLGKWNHTEQGNWIKYDPSVRLDGVRNFQYPTSMDKMYKFNVYEIQSSLNETSKLWIAQGIYLFFNLKL